jgi:hypothetical protein
MDNSYFTIIDPELFRTNLRYDGFEALPDRRAAGDDFDFTVDVHVHSNAVNWSKPALLNVHRDSQTNEFALGFSLSNLILKIAPSALFERLVQKFWVIAGIQHDFVPQRDEWALMGHICGLQQIASADFYTRKRQFFRRRVH